MGKRKEKTKESVSFEKKKKVNTDLKIVFSALILGLVFIVELYAIINLSQEFVLIGGVALLFLICLYVLIGGISTHLQEKHEREEEQYDSIFKSEKASYLLLRRYFEDSEKQMKALADQVEAMKNAFAQLEESSKIPTQEITRTQKGMGKVIISRSRENAEAILRSNDLLMEEFQSFRDALANSNEQMVEIYRKVGGENNQQVLEAQKSMLIDLKDMELRLNNVIVQSQKNVAQPPIYAAPMMQPMQMPPVQQVAPVAAPMPDPVAAMSAPEPMPVPEPVMEMPEPMIEPEPAVMAEPEPIFEPEPMLEPAVMSEPEPMPEPVVMAEPEPIPEPVVMSEPEPMPEPEPIVEEKPPMPDLSDPNKKMSPDDIAALFANMGGDSPAAAPAPEPVPEPVVEEKPPMPDLSDPNKKMSPDDIAALFANLGGDSPAAAPAPEPVPEPVVEEKPPMPDLSDPNKKMSPDDIAALFANLGGDSPAAAPAPEPEPEPVVEEKPPMPDLSDPNKKMSPDEIAALFASMAG